MQRVDASTRRTVGPTVVSGWFGQDKQTHSASLGILLQAQPEPEAETDGGAAGDPSSTDSG